MAYGAADPTIVKMAYAAAMADVPHDDSANMATIRDAYKSRMDNIEGIFKKMEEESELYNADMETAFKALTAAAADGTHSSAVIDDVADYITEMRGQWKEIPKGKEGEKGRMQWKSDMNKYASAFETEKGTLDYYSKLVANGAFSGLKQNINRFANQKYGRDIFKETNNKQQLINFLANFGKSIQKGALTMNQITMFEKFGLKLAGKNAIDVTE